MSALRLSVPQEPEARTLGLGRVLRFDVVARIVHVRVGNLNASVKVNVRVDEIRRAEERLVAEDRGGGPDARHPMVLAEYHTAIGDAS